MSKVAVFEGNSPHWKYDKNYRKKLKENETSASVEATSTTVAGICNLVLVKTETKPWSTPTCIHDHTSRVFWIND